MAERVIPNEVLFPNAPPEGERVIPPDQLGSLYEHLPKPETKPAATPKKPEQNAWNRIAIDEENNLLATKQFTYPHVSVHSKHYLADVESQDDSGALYYTNDRGEHVPTDESKHVVLRDPEDGKYKVFNRTPENTMGPVKGRLVGLGRILSMGLAAGPMPMARAATTGQKLLAATDKIADITGENIPISKAASSDNPVMGTAAHVATTLPGGAAPLERSAAATQQGLTRATQAASELPTGVAATADEAGQAARFGINERIKPKGLFDEAVGKSYDAVDRYITADKAQPLTNTAKTAQVISAERTAAAIAEESPAVKEVMEGITRPEGIGYQGLKRLRTRVGDMLSGKITSDGVDNGELKRIYGALSDDLKQLVLDQGGKRAVAAWEKANAHAALVARQKEQLAKILGVTGPKSDEAVYAAITRMAGSTSTANVKTLALAKRSMSPSEWNEIASATINRLGSKVEGNNRVFDPDRYLRDYGALSEKGKSLLFGDSTKLRTALDKISEVSERWGRVKEIAEPNPNAHTIGILGMFHRPLEAMSAMFGANRLGRMLAKPATAESVARWMDQYTQIRQMAKPTRAALMAYNGASRVLARDAAEDARDDIGTVTKAAPGFAAKMALSPVTTTVDTYEALRGKLRSLVETPK